jgi:hypothetical protein
MRVSVSPDGTLHLIRRCELNVCVPVVKCPAVPRHWLTAVAQHRHALGSMTTLRVDGLGLQDDTG